MLWAALLPDSLPADPQPRTEALDGLATWCLQFTPRVAVLEALLACPAVVMEVEQSVRLFGGKRRLVERVREECPDLGVRQLSWAPTSLAALAVARAGLSNGFAKPLTQLLDALPIETLTQVAAHQATLARLGCRTLGQVRALPRGGLSRRFDAQLLATLDQAYGLRPETYSWAQLPETFHAKLELMARVEHAPAMLFGARRLMLQMAGWLMARRSGVTAFTLRWCHDAMRARTAGDGGELTVRTAQATRDTEHLMRLLAEHLGKVELLAPVGDLALLATEVQSLEEKSLSMLPEARQSGESLALVLERIAARLGPDRVLRPVILEDHRLEWMCRWRRRPNRRHGCGAARSTCHNRLSSCRSPCGSRPSTTGRSTRACCSCSPGRTASRGMVGPHGGGGRRQESGGQSARDHAAGEPRLLGGRERACGRAVDLPDAPRAGRDRLVPARHLRLRDRPWTCPSTPNCDA